MAAASLGLCDLYRVHIKLYYKLSGASLGLGGVWLGVVLSSMISIMTVAPSIRSSSSACGGICNEYGYEYDIWPGLE